jgi:hypothetical protein
LLPENLPNIYLGQWAPIVGTGIAMAGSLVVYLTSTSADPETDGIDSGSISNSSCHCSVRPETHNSNHNRTKSTALTHVNTQRSMASTVPADKGGRRKVAQFMHKVGDYMGTPGQSRFDNPSYRRDYHNYPTIPGQEFRDAGLTNTERLYSSGRLSRSASRASDMRVAIPSTQDHAIQRTRSNSIGARSIDSQDPVSPTTIPGPSIMTRGRRDTLEVPSPVHVSSRDVLERTKSSGGSDALG